MHILASNAFQWFLIQECQIGILFVSLRQFYLLVKYIFGYTFSLYLHQQLYWI